MSRINVAIPFGGTGIARCNSNNTAQNQYETTICR